MKFLLSILFLWTGAVYCQDCGCEFNGYTKEHAFEHYKKNWKKFNESHKPLWEGDMVIDPPLLEYLYNPSKSETGDNVQKKYLWSKNRVNYFVGSDLNPNEVEKISQSLADLKRSLDDCITFQWLTENEIKTEKNYIHLTKHGGKGCTAPLGMLKGKQFMYLSKESCFTTGKIQHLFLHALGLTHEHNRPDRDKFIFIHSKNIVYEFCNKYFTCDRCETFGYPYDYSSVMHSDDNLDSCKEAVITMSSLTETDIYFQRKKATFHDLKKVKQFYQCDKLRPRF